MLGDIILLTGTSSSGKTTLTKTLQELLPQSYFHVGRDEFQPGFPSNIVLINDVEKPVDWGWQLEIREDPVWRSVMEDAHSGPAALRFLTGMYAAFAAFSAAGNNLIIDDVFWEVGALRAAVQALHAYPVLFVALNIPLEVAEQREKERGGLVGGARTFYDRAYANRIYDLEVDTSQCSPEECAQTIKDAVQAGHPRTAFARLAQELGVRSSEIKKG